MSKSKNKFKPVMIFLICVVCYVIILIILPPREKKRDCDDWITTIYTLKSYIVIYYGLEKNTIPSNLLALHKHAIKHNYWRESDEINPCTHKVGYDNAYTDNPKNNTRGIVYYSPVFNDKSKVVKYFLYTYNKDGSIKDVIEEVLSNG